MSKLRKMGTQVEAEVPKSEINNQQQKAKAEVTKSPLRLASKVGEGPKATIQERTQVNAQQSSVEGDQLENQLLMYCPHCKETNAKTSTHCWKCDKPLYKGAKRKKVKKERNISFIKIFFITLIPLAFAAFIFVYPFGNKLSKYQDWRIKKARMGPTGGGLTEDKVEGTWIGYEGNIYQSYQYGSINFNGGNPKYILSIEETSKGLNVQDFNWIPIRSNQPHLGHKLNPWRLYNLEGIHRKAGSLMDEKTFVPRNFLSFTKGKAFVERYAFEEVKGQSGVMLMHYLSHFGEKGVPVMNTVALYKISNRAKFDINHINGNEDWLNLIKYVRGDRPKIDPIKDSTFQGYHLGAEWEFVNFKGETKAVCKQVFPSQLCARLGVKPGDILVELNDKEVTKKSTITITLGSLEKNEKVKLKFMRKGKFKLVSTVPDGPKLRNKRITYRDDIMFSEDLKTADNQR